MRRYHHGLILLLSLCALPLRAGSSPDDTAVQAGREKIKTALTQRLPEAQLQGQLEALGFTPALVKDTLDYYRKELAKRAALERARANFTVGDAITRGNPKAPVTMIEFSDYECPYCGKAFPTVEQLRREYGDALRIAHRCYPMPAHEYARPACAAARAAGAQGKYWEMHEYLFTHQETLNTLAHANFGPAALALGLDWQRFKTEYDRLHADESWIEKEIKLGESWGVKGTPAFFVNGEKVDGAQPIEKFRTAIDAALADAKAKSAATPPPASPASAPARPAHKAARPAGK